MSAREPEYRIFGQVGTFTRAELRDLIRNGRLSPDHDVAIDGREWRRGGELPELAPYFARASTVPGVALVTPRTRPEEESGVRILGGLFAGLIAAALSAAIWGGLTVLTGYHFAFLAIGVGLLVGMVVRFHGATGFVYGLLAAALALFGCLAGDVLSGCFFVAWEQQVPYMEVVRGLSFTQASEIIADVFSPYDVLLYGLAMLEAFKLGAGGRIIKH